MMPISNKVKKRILKMYDRYENNILIKIRKDIRKYLEVQGKRISKAIIEKHVDTKEDEYTDEIDEQEAIEQSKEILDTAYNFDEDIKELTNLLTDLLLLSGEAGNELANIRLYSDESDHKLFGIIEENYLKFLDEYGLNQAKEITDTTIKNTRRIIKDGLIQGKSYSQIAQDIVDYTDIHSLGRATTIAVTETHTSFMTARNLNAIEGGFKEKAWLTSGDEAVRETHQQYGSLGYVPMDYKFGGTMLYPGDPNGSASEIIWCRCEILYR